MFFYSKRNKFLVQDTIDTKLPLVIVLKICFKFLKLFFVVSELMHIIKIGQVGQRKIILGCKRNNKWQLIFIESLFCAKNVIHAT